MAFVPGVSGNAAGRPRGFAGVARAIMRATRDGEELVEWALRVWRDEGADMRDRQAAHAWLSDRGLGRPLATVELNAQVAAVASPPTFDVAGLPLEDRRQLLEILQRARAARALAPGDVTDDIEVAP